MSYGNHIEPNLGMSKKLKELCGRCGHMHKAADAPAVGRFQVDGPLGYRALYEGAKLRSSRAEALVDMCNWRTGQR